MQAKYRLSKLINRCGFGIDSIAEQASAPPPPDPRNCGLLDAVQSGWYQNDTNELFKGFQVDKDDIVLDIGCGAGGATIFCAKRGAHVVFTDTVPEKIDALKHALADSPARKIEGFVSNSSPLPIPDAYASKIIALEVLEHVDSPADVLSEMVRVARPGAQFLLAVPDATGERIQMGLAPTSYFSRPNHIHIFDPERFDALVEGAGLIIEQRDSYGFFWMMWMLMYWTSAQAEGQPAKEVSHDVVHPPYPSLVEEWTNVWQHFISLPNSGHVKRSLDSLLPKSRIVIARKPHT